MKWNKQLLPVVVFGACVGCGSMDGNEDGNMEPLVTSTGSGFEAPEFYPAFSWDTVPVYMMFTRGDRLLLDSEVEKIAGETDFICIEKDHGLRQLGDAVLGLAHEKKAFEAVNPDIRTLGYLNSALTYPFTRYTKGFDPRKIDRHPELKAYLIPDAKDPTQPNVFLGQYCLNVLNPDMRAWWSDAGADMVKQSDAAGIFIDQMHGFLWLHGRGKQQEVGDGVADMMRQLKDKIGPDKILVANNAAHIDAIFPIADAFMFEHYKREATHTKEKLLKDWQLMEKIAAAGKICIYRFQLEPEPGSPLAEAKPHERIHGKHAEFAALSKEQLEFYLALYLIGAQPYSYFQWNWSWNLQGGPLEHYPELHKPLGKPLGRYTRVRPDGWEFTREFEHASVWVDTDKWEARIDWK